MAAPMGQSHLGLAVADFAFGGGPLASWWPFGSSPRRQRDDRLFALAAQGPRQPGPGDGGGITLLTSVASRRQLSGMPGRPGARSARETRATPGGAAVFPFFFGGGPRSDPLQMRKWLAGRRGLARACAKGIEQPLGAPVAAVVAPWIGTTREVGRRPQREGPASVRVVHPALSCQSHSLVKGSMRNRRYYPGIIDRNSARDRESVLYCM